MERRTAAALRWRGAPGSHYCSSFFSCFLCLGLVSGAILSRPTSLGDLRIDQMAVTAPKTARAPNTRKYDSHMTSAPVANQYTKTRPARPSMP